MDDMGMKKQVFPILILHPGEASSSSSWRICGCCFFGASVVNPVGPPWGTPLKYGPMVWEAYLVGGFNPVEKILVKMGIFPK